MHAKFMEGAGGLGVRVIEAREGAPLGLEPRRRFIKRERGPALSFSRFVSLSLTHTLALSRSPPVSLFRWDSGLGDDSSNANAVLT